jgi:hypothetical protein
MRVLVGQIPEARSPVANSCRWEVEILIEWIDKSLTRSKGAVIRYRMEVRMESYLYRLVDFAKEVVGGDVQGSSNQDGCRSISGSISKANVRGSLGKSIARLD